MKKGGKGFINKTSSKGTKRDNKCVDLNRFVILKTDKSKKMITLLFRGRKYK